MYEKRDDVIIEDFTKEKTLDVIALIHAGKTKAGLSIKPNTPVKEIEKYLDKVDLVLVMTVEPGFGGQSFLKDCSLKIAEIKKVCPSVLVEVDGGINEETAKICRQLGVDVLVAGSFIFKAEDRKKQIESLNK